jgi:hypothetical protein
MTFEHFERWNTAHHTYRFENCRFLSGFEITNSAGRPFLFSCAAEDLLADGRTRQAGGAGPSWAPGTEDQGTARLTMRLNAQDFGVVGDGQQHNTPELMALRDHIRAGPDRIWQVEFEPGHYLYHDERWLNFADRTVILEFNGSSVECAARPFLPLGAGPIAWDAEFPATQTIANATIQAGHLIETAPAGAHEVRLKEAAPDYYRTGDLILVAGDLQQLSEDGTRGWGWPPNFARFGWHRVERMADAQTVLLADSLRYTYDANWPDFPTDFFGAPRIYGAPRIFGGRLDDGREIIRSLTIRNANFIAGRNQPARTLTPLSGRGWHIRFENCSTGENTLCWPSECYRNDYVNCRFGGRHVEMDKIVEQCSMERCEVHGALTSGGGSVLDASFRDVRFYGLVQATPRRSWRFEGACHFEEGVMLSRGLTNTPFALTGTASQV